MWTSGSAAPAPPPAAHALTRGAIREMPPALTTGRRGWGRSSAVADAQMLTHITCGWLRCALLLDAVPAPPQRVSLDV